MKNFKKLNRSGFAPIMFAIFIAIVMCLIAIGFAFLSTNDQRQTLDKTLSSQANYAAESAINQIQYLFHQDSTTPDNIGACSNDPTPGNKVNTFKTNFHDANTNADISITCLRWDSSLSMLVYDPVDINPAVVPIFPSPAVGSVTIKWRKSSRDTGAGTSTYGASSQLQLGDSSNIPTLKIAGARNDDINDVGVVYLNPVSSGTDSASINTDTSSSGSISNISCVSGECSVVLTLGWTEGYLSISSLNGMSHIEISAGSSVLTKAQVQVDATAKSQDVIKRIVAYAPLNKTTWHPSFVASADVLCKNYAVNGSAGNDDMYTGMVSTTNLCPPVPTPTPIPTPTPTPTPSP